MLEIGKTYLTKSGHKVVVLLEHMPGKYLCQCLNSSYPYDYFYNKYGQFIGNEPTFDLILDIKYKRYK